MNVVIPAKSGINKTIEVSVIKDGTLTEVGSCNIGERIDRHLSPGAAFRTLPIPIKVTKIHRKRNKTGDDFLLFRR